ncbi:hypothetical protein F0562_000280 [Nyssa sinensis]|uniref:Uncharacterized protein n=1 Tax=Nyssa sinensis TaxID=561372 RepID=A0A5J5C112_9ASTE|nr:hypothetical protein F0562_000280 [Nyssa sinensis]
MHRLNSSPPAQNSRRVRTLDSSENINLTVDCRHLHSRTVNSISLRQSDQLHVGFLSCDQKARVLDKVIGRLQ